jgi:hypothetical protein
VAYNKKQFDAALDFLQAADANVVDTLDKRRIQAQDLYENLYINSTFNLKLLLRGDESYPIIMPSGQKMVEATNRFLGLNIDYLVEGQGDGGTQESLDEYFKSFFKREAFKSKFESSKRWSLIRGDGVLLIVADPNKDPGERLSIHEIDPRQLFEIEDANGNLTGYYIAEVVQDFRDANDSSKTICKRTSYKKSVDDNGQPTGTITTDVTHWEIAKWDDRHPSNDLEQVASSNFDEEEMVLPEPITQLPIYHWRNKPFPGSDWGTSQLAGLETLLYALNQTLSDEDATIVFQGLGMYVTTSGAPIDNTTGEITNWNIGPKQVIEIGSDQKFERVTGVTSMQPFQDHMNYIAEKGLSESSGIPEVAIGRVDVASAQSGIALKLELLPLLSANAEKELELITVIDQLFYDITTQWLPAYEEETFGNAETMAEMSVVCVFDDPLPVDRDAEIQEMILLRTSNLILTSMAVKKLQSLGWHYPAVDQDGNPLDADGISDLLNAQAQQDASNIDPFASANTGNLDSFDSAAGVQTPPTNVTNALGQAPSKNTPTKTSVPLAGS